MKAIIHHGEDYKELFSSSLILVGFEISRLFLDKLHRE
jgi:hypothetical protein